MTADTALDLLYGLLLEDGRRWGQAAEDFQRDDAAAILDIQGARRHFLTRPRGASKTSDLAAIGIAVLVEQAPPHSRSYAVAADRDQAGLLIDAIAGFVARTPALSGVLAVDRWKVTGPGNATLEVLPADDASAWGLRPYLLIVDERAQWRDTHGPEQLWTALFTALPKVPDSRLVILTSAGDPAHPAHDILETAKANPDRWRVSETPGPCPWLDDEDLAEQKEMLPEWEYRRLHLNQWTEPDDRLTTASDLAECVTLTDWPLDHRKGHQYVATLDVGLKNDRTALAVCHRDDEQVVLDRLVVWQGSRRDPVNLDEVEATILKVHADYGRPPLVFDPWQSAQLTQRLRKRGVQVEEFTFTASSVGNLARRLHNAIREHRLALPDDPDLIDELAHVRLRETSPGVYRLDHDAGRHDDRAIALALAVNRLTITARRTSVLTGKKIDLSEGLARRGASHL